MKNSRPVILRRRVKGAAMAQIDWPTWEPCTKAEQAEQVSLKKVLTNWNKGRRP
jgi:hypothetical protein